VRGGEGILSLGEGKRLDNRLVGRFGPPSLFLFKMVK
jgi:hypothetical protein